MYALLIYISQGIKFGSICLFILFLTQYISIIYIITALFLVVLCYNFLIYIDVHPNKSSTNLKELESFTEKLSQEHKLSRISIDTTDGYSGALYYKLLKPNVLYIPSDANPKLEGAESKAVIAHEMAHMIYNDIYKFLLIKIILINVSSVILYILFPILNLISFVNVVILLMLVLPSILNYINHKFEYRADEFAVKYTSKDVVSTRLRRNKRLFENPWYRKYFPYIMSHPNTEERLRNILTR